MGLTISLVLIDKRTRQHVPQRAIRFIGIFSNAIIATKRSSESLFILCNSPRGKISLWLFLFHTIGSKLLRSSMHRCLANASEGILTSRQKGFFTRCKQREVSPLPAPSPPTRRLPPSREAQLRRSQVTNVTVFPPYMCFMPVLRGFLRWRRIVQHSKIDRFKVRSFLL